MTKKSRTGPGDAAPADEHAGTSRIAYYIRLAAVFKDRIKSGEWAPGQQLPTIPQLCERYAVAHSTVRQAVQLLVSDGLLTSARGRGTFVAEGARGFSATDDDLNSAINDPLAMGPHETIRLLLRQKGVSLPTELSSAREGESGHALKYVRIQKMHSLRGVPFNLADIYVSEEVYRRLPPRADQRAKVSQLIRDHGEVQITRNRQQIAISRADAEVAALFGCPVGEVLVRIRRWRTDDKGDVIFAGINLYRGDMFVMDLVDEDPNDFNYRPGVLPGGVPNRTRTQR